MTNDTSGLLGRTLIRHQVSPYYIFLDEHPAGSQPIQRRVQRGFDVDLYGSPLNGELHRDDDLLRSTLEDLTAVAEQIVPPVADNSEIEIVPVVDTLIISPSKGFKAEALLRIRISHGGALDQPAGAHEEELVHAMIEKVEALQAARQ